ncbi:MAG: flagellar basal body P-ring protein FlgI [Tepidisphaerales bacterium]
MKTNNKPQITNNHGARAVAAVLVVVAVIFAAPIQAAVKIGDLARLSGERKNVLVGWGLVFGLKGTGDGGQYLPAMRPLMEMLKKLYNPVSLPELGDTKNVAIVTLTVALPASGVRNGEELDVRVTSTGSASSLKGGHLIAAPLFALNPDLGIFGQATGDIELEDPSNPNSGIVRQGALIDVDLPVKVVDETGHLTLILNESSAHRVTASTIAKIINDAEGNSEQIAVAVDGKNVVVAIPSNEQTRSNDFISRILQLPVRIMPTEARVVVNRKTGTIVITGDVEISPVVISHQGLTITTVTPAPVATARSPVTNERRALALDTTGTGGPKLRDLVDALDAIKVPANDRISILEQLEKSGYLHAKLIVE